MELRLKLGLTLGRGLELELGLRLGLGLGLWLGRLGLCAEAVARAGADFLGLWPIWRSLKVVSKGSCGCGCGWGWGWGWGRLGRWPGLGLEHS